MLLGRKTVENEHFKEIARKFWTEIILLKAIEEVHYRSYECNFKVVAAAEKEEKMIRDAFIQSHYIRQWCLDNITLDFETAYTQASSFEIGGKALILIKTQCL